MESFENVTIGKKANVYFNGKVTSRSITLPSGEKKTLGVMLAGEYEFKTEAPELMEVTEGGAEVRLDGEELFTWYATGDSFEVPGNSSFQLKVPELLDYVCSFLDQ